MLRKEPLPAAKYQLVFQFSPFYIVVCSSIVLNTVNHSIKFNRHCVYGYFGCYTTMIQNKHFSLYTYPICVLCFFATENNLIQITDLSDFC